MWDMRANEFAKVGVQVANFRSRPRELPALCCLCFERRMLRREFPFFQAHETRSRPVQRFIERCRHQRAVSFHNFGTRPVRTALNPKPLTPNFKLDPNANIKASLFVVTFEEGLEVLVVPDLNIWRSIQGLGKRDRNLKA